MNVMRFLFGFVLVALFIFLTSRKWRRRVVDDECEIPDSEDQEHEDHETCTSCTFPGVDVVYVESDKKEDESLMSREEFFKRVDDAKKRPAYELKPGESLEDLIERVEH